MKATTFQVSDKVVCVNRPANDTRFTPRVVVGRVYVVRGFRDYGDGKPALLLVGVRGRRKDGQETGHFPERFNLLSAVQKRGVKAATPKSTPEPETAELPVREVRWLDAERGEALHWMRENALAELRAGMDAQAFTRLCGCLEHDCPIWWLLLLRRRVARERSKAKKGGEV